MRAKDSAIVLSRQNPLSTPKPANALYCYGYVPAGAAADGRWRAPLPTGREVPGAHSFPVGNTRDR